jgi:phage tail sheath protein FI
MPEYLSPGVYVEETSYRAKSIEGVATSTAGFVGQTRFGPTSGAPMLVTSFEEFQRHFGDGEDLLLAEGQRMNQLAQSARLFFENGGRRLYVGRVWRAPAAGTGVAEGPAMNVSGAERRFRARFPGRAGNLVVSIAATRSGNLLTGTGAGRGVAGVRAGDLVESATAAAGVKDRTVTATGPAALTAANLYAVSLDSNGRPVLTSATGTALDLTDATLGSVQKVTFAVLVEPNGDGSTGSRTDSVGGLSTHPDSDTFIGRVLRQENPTLGVEPPADRTQRVWLDAGTLPSDAGPRSAFAGGLAVALMTGSPFRLTGGLDGRLAESAQFLGAPGANPTGLVAMEAIEDIAIVAAPGSAGIAGDGPLAVRDALISHAERMRYRFAILAGPQDADTAGIRATRGQHDSKYAALYHPWLVIPAPSGASGETALLSPEGAMAGIYARSDIERGVHKAPANEVVRGILRFSRNVTRGDQDVLNPEGVNCLRFFEGRGNRVWGARTISSDPEWMYVNVRRLFIFLEHSIDRGTQWAVFEPNNEALWLRIRLTIESFLTEVWRTGALMGTKPEEAFFVRCDRTTMTQSDLDNGRLICLIGVAPTKPAEFVIFRIGQWTADASII